MSCYRKYTADVLKKANKKDLHKACQRLGFDFDESKKEVNASFERRREKVDAVLVKDGKALSLGFNFNKDGKFEVEGDFWRTGLADKTFVDDLSQAYAGESLKRQLRVNYGMRIDKDEINEDGDLVIEAICC